MERRTSMHPFVRFLKTHPHCTERVCTTCGGIMYFRIDLERWVQQEGIDLAELLSTLTIEDLQPIRNWPAYLAEAVSLIPEDAFREVIFPRWRLLAGKVLDFDCILLSHAPAGAYDHLLDGRWLANLLISELRFDFRYYDLPWRSGIDLDQVERFMGTDVYPIIIELKKELEKYRLEEIERRRRLDEEWKAKRAAEEARWKEKLQQLGELPPVERLRTILADTEKKIEEYPIEWTDVPEEAFPELTSIQLTELLRKFDRRLSRRKKNPWRDLRSRLYLIRQKVYNREFYDSEAEGHTTIE